MVDRIHADRKADPHEDADPPVRPFLVGENGNPSAPSLLGVSKETYRGWVRDGLITPVELPGGIRRRLYLLSDLEQFAASLAAKR